MNKALVFILGMIFSIILFLSINSPAIKKSPRPPPEGEWLCWASSVKTKTCGAYAWNSNRRMARKLVLKICENMCGKCRLDYCRFLKR